MGGSGSGRWGGHRSAVPVEACWRLDIRALAGVGQRSSGTWTWKNSRTGQESLSVTWALNESGPVPYLHLAYVSGDGQQLSYRIAMQTTTPHYGGARRWFTCPLVVQGIPCRRRVAKLYRPPGRRFFGCRRCYGLTYASVQEHDKRVDALRKNRDVLARLAADPSNLPINQLGLLLKAIEKG